MATVGDVDPVHVDNWGNALGILAVSWQPLGKTLLKVKLLVGYM